MNRNLFSLKMRYAGDIRITLINLWQKYKKYLVIIYVKKKHTQNKHCIVYLHHHRKNVSTYIYKTLQWGHALKNWKFKTMWKNLIFNNNFFTFQICIWQSPSDPTLIWYMCDECVRSRKKNWVCCLNHEGINLNKPIHEFNNNNKKK